VDPLFAGNPFARPVEKRLSKILRRRRPGQQSHRGAAPRARQSALTLIRRRLAPFAKTARFGDSGCTGNGGRPCRRSVTHLKMRTHARNAEAENKARRWKKAVACREGLHHALCRNCRTKTRTARLRRPARGALTFRRASMYFVGARRLRILPNRYKFLHAIRRLRRDGSRIASVQ
jgi:hypothetical protein